MFYCIKSHFLLNLLFKNLLHLSFVLFVFSIHLPIWFKVITCIGLDVHMASNRVTLIYCISRAQGLAVIRSDEPAKGMKESHKHRTISILWEIG